MGQVLPLHESPDAFREALSFTAAESGFSQRLIEKDYYCSLILGDLTGLFAHGLVFKGGTCLSKVHVGFCRLSEDLDFAVSIPTTARRSDRRRAVIPIKEHLQRIAERLPPISISEPLRGHDDCRQYNATLRYESVVTGEHETVKVQVSVREPIIEATVLCRGRTLLHHPVPAESPDLELPLSVLSLRETYAEKVRAALTRDPPAIRDIFDLHHAVRTNHLDLSEPGFLELVRQKLAVAGNTAVDMSHARRKLLEDQLETNLKPVLRSSDYSLFDAERALALVDEVARMVCAD
ncbi:MAG: nucleotidyl transferase AbiEii/AbiGii toxin family protein [Patescibacteria group bacterium]|nr:nucleotidyl transferase AbiEii/AbiGii toxin family protein [Patescibacteria group bacterium]